jgi:hypothetical protein
MWSMLRGNKGRCMFPKKGCKPLKDSQKIPKSRCGDLERRDHCLVTGNDHTSLLITNMVRDFRNKIIAAECVFSKISKGSVRNGQKGFAIVSISRLMFNP